MREHVQALEDGLAARGLQPAQDVSTECFAGEHGQCTGRAASPTSEHPVYQGAIGACSCSCHAAPHPPATFRLLSGVTFDPFNPRPDLIRIADIAHGLAMTCRFAGQIRRFYSVAEHSIYVSQAAGHYARASGATERGIWICEVGGMVHEAAEAIGGIGDVIGPIKRHPTMAAIKEHELRIEAAVAERYKLPHGFAGGGLVKRADLAVYARENYHLRNIVGSCEVTTSPPIPCLSWQDARAAFCARWTALTGEEVTYAS